VQRELLGVELADIQQALMKAWHLPELLVRISDDHHADTAQVKNVLLAMRVARHSAQGWDNPAIPDDVADIGRLLNLAEAHTRRLLQELDAAPPETEQPLA
jgi:HD-like signal output (HDOD) protein